MATAPLQPSSIRKRHVLALLLLTLAGAAPYWPARNAAWFFDSSRIFSLPEVRSVSDAVARLWATKWRPGQELSVSVFAVDRAVNVVLGKPEFDIRVFVLTNVLTHVANVWLLYAFIVTLQSVRRDDRSDGALGAFLASLLYAAHPLHVTSVTYIVQLRGLFCAMFYLLTMLAYLRLRSHHARHRRIGWAALALMSAWACVKSKSIGITLPLAILGLEFCIQAREPRSLRRFFAWALFLASCIVAGGFISLAAVGYLDIHTLSFRQAQSLNAEANYGVAENVLTQARAFIEYWRLLVWPAPSRLCLDRAFALTRDLTDAASWGCAAVHLVLVFLGCRFIVRGRVSAGFGLLFFYITLIPWAVMPQAVLFTEYRTYMPALGAALACAELMRLISPRRLTRCGIPFVVVVSSTLAAITWNRNALLSDPIAIWQDVVDKNPGHFLGLYNLANALFKEGKFEESAERYREAARMDPDDHRPHFNLANTLMKLNRPREAAMEYGETIRRKPDHAAAREALRRLGLEVRIRETSVP